MIISRRTSLMMRFSSQASFPRVISQDCQLPSEPDISRSDSNLRWRTGGIKYLYRDHIFADFRSNCYPSEGDRSISIYFPNRKEIQVVLTSTSISPSIPKKSIYFTSFWRGVEKVLTVTASERKKIPLTPSAILFSDDH
ncbi:hypothetical protein CEXT_54521 [Caerostris extrusa]|uniref:Uncharacterized protein n=1 Tax=Caerostris extrusa TaxID=172846 RepID=A0AAV4NK03_CAEEX|nr:hypothetical protein CEXT_54521 [Caerostris extrusa]